MPEHVGCHANPGNEKGSAETKHCSKNLREEARANSTRPGTPFWGARVGAASLIQESEDSGSRFSWKQRGATAPIQTVSINLRPPFPCRKWGFRFACRPWPAVKRQTSGNCRWNGFQGDALQTGQVCSESTTDGSGTYAGPHRISERRAGEHPRA
jgi:hypothetical protein